jgi:hypothetical protein
MMEREKNYGNSFLKKGLNLFQHCGIVAFEKLKWEAVKG